MNEDDTYQKLKQTPFIEMCSLLDNFEPPLKAISPVYILGSATVSRSSYYPNVIAHQEKMKFLESNGWTMDEFCIAVEKNAILSQVEEFNNNVFPKELLERAVTFFPNIKFIEAKIELE